MAVSYISAQFFPGTPTTSATVDFAAGDGLLDSPERRSICASITLGAEIEEAIVRSHLPEWPVMQALPDLLPGLDDPVAQAQAAQALVVSGACPSPEAAAEVVRLLLNTRNSIASRRAARILLRS